MFDACSIDFGCIFDRFARVGGITGGWFGDDWMDVGGCGWMYVDVDVCGCVSVWGYVDLHGCGWTPEVWPGYAAVWGLCADLSEK